MSLSDQQLAGDYQAPDETVSTWLASRCHKRIAVSYLVALCATFLLGITFAFFLRAELLSPNRLMVSHDVFRQMLSMHGLLMVFCCIVPAIPAVLGNYLLPLMLRSANVASPQLNVWSLRLYLIGISAFVLASITGAVTTGWQLSPPYGSMPAIPLALIGIGMHAIGFHLAFTGLNFVLTIYRNRSAGTSWFELPFFCGALLITGLLQLLLAPILAGMGLLVLGELGGSGTFDPLQGGDPLAWRQLFWFFSHPAVFIALVPAIGVVADIFVTFARKPLHAPRSSFIALIMLALLGTLGWGTHMITGGQSAAASTVFSALSLLVMVPAAALLVNLLATLHRGAIELSTPLLFGIAFLLQTAIGGIGALFLGSLATAEQFSGTLFETACFHYLFVGGALTAFLAGLHYWWPLIFGRTFNETKGRWSVALLFAGTNLTFFSGYLLGLARVFPDQYSYPSAVLPLQIAAAIGALLLCGGLLLIFVNLFSSIVGSKRSDINPWGATTPEWRK
jgi:cytochrome c oxidase subunit I